MSPYRNPPETRSSEDPGLLDRVERTHQFETEALPGEVLAELERVAGLVAWQRLGIQALKGAVLFGLALIGVGVGIMLDSRSDTGFMLGISGCAAGGSLLVSSMLFWRRRRRDALDRDRYILAHQVLKGFELNHREPVRLFLDLGRIECPDKQTSHNRYKDPWFKLDATFREGVKLSFQRIDHLRLEVRVHRSSHVESGRVRQTTSTNITRHWTVEDRLVLDGVDGSLIDWGDDLLQLLALSDKARLEQGQAIPGGLKAAIRHDLEWRKMSTPAQVILMMVGNLGAMSGASDLMELSAALESPPRRMPPRPRLLAAPGLAVAAAILTLPLLVLSGLWFSDMIYARGRAAEAEQKTDLRLRQLDTTYFNGRARKSLTASFICLGVALPIGLCAGITGVTSWRRRRRLGTPGIE